MNLPKIDPIVWKKKQEKHPDTIPVHPQSMPPPPPDDVRHDYFGGDGILYIHYPGFAIN